MPSIESKIRLQIEPNVVAAYCQIHYIRALSRSIEQPNDPLAESQDTGSPLMKHWYPMGPSIETVLENIPHLDLPGTGSKPELKQNSKQMFA